jgi:hypothetical protein
LINNARQLVEYAPFLVSRNCTTPRLFTLGGFAKRRERPRTVAGFSFWHEAKKE